MPPPSLRALVLGAAASSVALLLALTLFFAVELRRHVEDLAWVEHTHAVLELIGEARVQADNARLARQAYLSGGSPAARVEADRAAAAARAAAASIQSLTSDNPPEAARAAALAAAPEAPGAQALCRAMDGKERRLLAEREARARRTAAVAVSALSAEALLAALLGAATLWLILRGLDEREALLRRTTENERALLAANEGLDAFAHSVAHDLRAPLRAIEGFVKVLEETLAPPIPAEARRLLGRVRDSAIRMSRLIDDLLDFARLGRQELRVDRADMAALARRAAAAAAAAEPGLEVILEIGVLPLCRGDGAMLAVVWNNLLSNAYKYSRSRRPARIVITGEDRGDGLEYRIEDNGIGFDQRYAGNLFKVFSRLHGTEVEGTGVGLALVRRIVERHGGTVSGEGVVGRGAVFRFVLPPAARG